VVKRLVGAGALIAILATSVAAQPQPQPAPPPQPQPQPQQPAAPPQWYRFTLVDGRVLDVQIVGGDAASYHIQTGGQVYSIPRANVASSIALAAPTAYAPPPTAYAPPAPMMPSDDRNFIQRNRRAAGWAYLGSMYLLTAGIALARRDSDSDATTGLIPVVGPMIWAGINDEDKLMEDGWDWLAATDTLMQGIGVYLILTGDQDEPGQPKYTLAPLARNGAHGLSFSGRF
jgi:hypothetical protein